MAKVSITLKDPDYHINTKTPEDRRILRDSGLLEKFIEWDEYVTVEFDTILRTVRVLPVK